MRRGQNPTSVTHAGSVPRQRKWVASRKHGTNTAAPRIGAYLHPGGTVRMFTVQRAARHPRQVAVRMSTCNRATRRSWCQGGAPSLIHIDQTSNASASPSHTHKHTPKVRWIRITIVLHLHTLLATLCNSFFAAALRHTATARQQRSVITKMGAESRNQYKVFQKSFSQPTLILDPAKLHLATSTHTRMFPHLSSLHTILEILDTQNADSK